MESRHDHAMPADMLNMRNLTGIVDVDGFKYEWEL